MILYNLVKVSQANFIYSPPEDTQGMKSGASIVSGAREQKL